ncbi:MAG: hypothetical protein OXC63_15400 [Aestuariivita sp.]|nr:hypothetical protein [Aestuariivita sp.]MCY4346793.1 hypothetical protein [Aestuariivita sp.]
MRLKSLLVATIVVQGGCEPVNSPALEGTLAVGPIQQSETGSAEPRQLFDESIATIAADRNSGTGTQFEVGRSSSANLEQPRDADRDIILDAASVLAEPSSGSDNTTVEASPANPPPKLLDNASISDENDFTAVSERETIASDAERIARNQSQYQVVLPTDVPERSQSTTPNIVEFALQTNNEIGDQIYSRFGSQLRPQSERRCASYASSDLAQLDFLSRGGPQSDTLGIDPDGDGFACSWDPKPYRAAVRN